MLSRRIQNIVSPGLRGPYLHVSAELLSLATRAELPIRSEAQRNAVCMSSSLRPSARTGTDWEVPPVLMPGLCKPAAGLMGELRC